MRIQGTGGPPTIAASAAQRRPAASGFAVETSGSAPTTISSSALRTMGGIDALLALQGIEDPVRRRQHALKRGRLTLDALDELKISLLGGSLEPAVLTRLKSAATVLKEDSGDAGLDAVLAEIDLRAEVEIAKLDKR